MKKVIKMIALFVTCFCFPSLIKVNACSDAELVRLRRLIQNIASSYTYTESDKTVRFTITFTNVHPDLYIVDDNRNRDLVKVADMEYVATDHLSGRTYAFKVYSHITACSYDTLHTIYINLPTYNPYYDDEVCIGAETYKLCQKWQAHSLTHEQFVKDVNKYKSEKDKIVEEEEEYSQSIFDWLLEFYINYYYIILPTIIIGSSVGIVISKRRENLFNM